MRGLSWTLVKSNITWIYFCRTAHFHCDERHWSCQIVVNPHSPSENPHCWIPQETTTKFNESTANVTTPSSCYQSLLISVYGNLKPIIRVSSKKEKSWRFQWFFRGSSWSNSISLPLKKIPRRSHRIRCFFGLIICWGLNEYLWLLGIYSLFLEIGESPFS